MSSQAGGMWGPNDPLAPYRLDAKSVFWGTGLEILGIPQVSEIKFAICTETGSGFIANTAYVRSADKTQWLPVFGKHKHDADTDAAGGKLAAIMIANQGKVKKFERKLLIEWRGRSKAAGSPAGVEGAVNNTHYSDFSTGATLNDYTNFYDSDGLRADLSKPMAVSFKAQFSHVANIVGRAGVNIENAQSSVALGNKFWVEWCDTHGTKLMAGASNTLGITLEATPTDVVPVPNAARGYRLDFTPADQVFYSDSSGGTKTLTTNIPSSGQVPADRLFAGGVQTKNASQVKSFFIWNVEISYEVLDTWL